jgi:hypothetical protein
MYVCMYVCMYECMYVCICMYVCMCVYIYIYIYIYIYMKDLCITIDTFQGQSISALFVMTAVIKYILKFLKRNTYSLDSLQLNTQSSPASSNAR